MGMILLNEQFYLFQDLGIQKGAYFSSHRVLQSFINRVCNHRN